MFDIEIDQTGNKRLLLLRHINGDVGGDSHIYLDPIYIGKQYGINLQTIQSVLSLLEQLEHIVVEQEPNHNLTDEQRLRRDDEEDYFWISLKPSFLDYYKAVETAATFYTADQIVTPGSGISAELSFESITTPVVTVQGGLYRLPSMRTGTAFNIISYCLEKHPNQTLSISEVKSELKANGMSAHGITNLSENIRNSHFGKKKPLNAFVVVSPNAIQVKPVTLLSNKQFEDIIRATS